MMLYIFCGIFVVMAYVVISNSHTVVVSHWHHSFDEFTYSPRDFYKSAHAAISKKELPGISFSEIIHLERGLLSARREYLRVTQKEYHIDICAAPFGKGFYVSWYLVERRDLVKELARKWQPLADFLETKTYYQVDTQIMLKEYIHAGIMEAIDEMTNAKGIRLTPEDRRIADTNSRPYLK